jgi:predicted nucleotidyltransferase
MLEIFNTLKPFFEDNYRRINVREYSRIQKISPPTASKILAELNKRGILKREQDKQFIYYYADKDSDLFIDMQKIYYKKLIKEAGLIDFFEKELLNPVIFLFGSLSKAEAKKDSDIDLAIFTSTKKEVDIKKYEKLLKRKIQLFIFKDKEELKIKELLNNILNGYKIAGNF